MFVVACVEMPWSCMQYSEIPLDLDVHDRSIYSRAKVSEGVYGCGAMNRFFGPAAVTVDASTL